MIVYATRVHYRDNNTMTIDERLEKLAERHEALTQTVELQAREIAQIGPALRRAIELGVRELRNERKRRQALDEKMTQANTMLNQKMAELADAQMATEEKLQAFIKYSMRGQ